MRASPFFCSPKEKEELIALLLARSSASLSVNDQRQYPQAYAKPENKPL
jgi:hypothetical protein